VWTVFSLTGACQRALYAFLSEVCLMSSGARVVFMCTGIGEDDLRVWTWRGVGRAEVDDLSRWVAHRRVRGLGGIQRS
jgi:hypothetical protein